MRHHRFGLALFVLLLSFTPGFGNSSSFRFDPNFSGSPACSEPAAWGLVLTLAFQSAALLAGLVVIPAKGWPDIPGMEVACESLHTR